MKKSKIISIIIGIIIIIIIIIGAFLVHNNSISKSVKKKDTTTKTTKSANATNVTKDDSQKLSLPTPLFTDEQKTNYYKISQAVGDIGLPSNSLVTNLDNYKVIDGVKYFDAYSYATRTSLTTPVLREDANNNFSGQVNEYKLVGLNGKKLDNSNVASSEDINNLSSEDKYIQLYKIASEYIEGYTANYPNMKIESNDNYEGNLNDITDLKIDLNNTKVIAGHKTYEVIVDINNFHTPIYVGLDGYIFVSTPTDYEQLFFPGWLNQNIPINKA